MMYHSRQRVKLLVVSVLWFLLLSYGVSNVHCWTVHESNRDLRSLLEFRQGIISDPSDALSNWNTSTHFCRWHGVSCTSTRPWRVRKLNLTGQNLAGQISPSLGNLTFLTKLNLSYNNFHGPVPPLNKLHQLQNLSLANNFLQDVIPAGLMNCSNLTILDLSRNSLTGTIPPSIGILSKLEHINFDENGLIGVIPPALGNITTLKVVDLRRNQLSGRIPNEFWKTSSIELLFLGINSLSGGIPNPLPNISSLMQLSLAFNMLSGELPSNIGDALPNIQRLFMGYNDLKGRIPASLGKPLGLKRIDLSRNYFTGQIPSSFGELQQLEYLNLQRNNLEARDSEGWEFFDALSNCSHLNVLSLADNYLQGAIPNSIANLATNLTYLFMGGNQLSGIVPPGISKLDGLTQLALDVNNLTGTIIEWIGKLRNLVRLYLHSNNFAGTIPPSISNLTQLEHLFLEENKFTGFIPSSLGSLQKLLMLNLSNNNFQGIIPVEFGNFTQIFELDISFNKFDGEIPQTLGQLEHIQTIQMDHNILTGNIPAAFTKLKALMVLNISHNNLSGSLPSYLNDMKSLDKLDLSFNNFRGEIPTNGVLDNATIVSLDGNPGLCGGAVDLHLPSCHVKSRKVDRAKFLVKVLIPIFGFMSLVLLVYFCLLGKKTSRRVLISENSFGEHFEKVTYNDLAQETQGFSESNMIGRGKYGTIYRARLKESKMEVAIKVFNLEMRGAERSFLSECEALRKIQHRNILPIITACSSIDNAGNDFKALAYELMPNGDLDSWIHHSGDKEASSRRCLSLTQRINLAVNVADALNYLHHDCGRPTVHCDVKPSNILLDGDMNARLGDFGIARFYTNIQSTWPGSTCSSVGVKGTIGYIPPEYGGGGHVSTSGDVYSFGIVLLEMLTSKRPIDSMFMDGLDIVSFVENNLPGRIFHIIDGYLAEECMYLTRERKVPEKDIYRCLAALLQLSLSCTRSLPSERLNMKQVATKLRAIKASHLGWNL